MTGLKNNEKKKQPMSKEKPDLQKAWRTIAQDHFLTWQKESLEPWEQNIKKWEVIQDFCTVLYVHILYADAHQQHLNYRYILIHSHLQ